MNKNHHITTQAQLEQLIKRYFDGETSLQEEQQLRQCLADCPWSSQTIDEALFTMGYFAAHSHETRPAAKKTSHRQFIGIAASIAIVLSVGGYAIWHQQQAGGECIAYVNGQIIKSDAQVMAMVAEDMNMMGNAADVVNDQLSSLGEVLEIDNE